MFGNTDKKVINLICQCWVFLLHQEIDDTTPVGYLAQ